MKKFLMTTAAFTMLASSALADVFLMDGMVPREGDNRVIEAGTYQKDGPWKIGFSIWGFGNTWMIQMAEEARYAASQNENVGDFIFSNADSNPAKQIADIEDMIAQGVDAIVIAPVSLNAVSPIIDKAAAAGIPVVVHSTAVDTDNYTVDIQGDPHHFGKVMGDFLVDELGGEGNIWVLRGQAGVSEDLFRYEGLLTALEGTDITISSEQHGDWAYDKGKQVCESLALSDPNPDGIWSSGAAMTHACMDVFVELGLPIPPISGEGNNGFFKVWKASGAKSMAAVFPPEQGAAAVRAAMALLEGEEMMHRYVGQPDPILQDQREDYLREDLNENLWFPSSLPEEKLQEIYGQN
ncbi:ABC transporter substrate-binding protein [uncultured Marivita sp.]|uniref:ABC transporter substrate-binding protein n=1 Tax=uncultured Marivita sp. TaxID=888080 RepID=UPI002634FC1D|nr:ABC transporter substrate-binding protein [uncultured Marivita sp.]